MEEAFRALILAQPGIAALIGTRVYPLVLPQGFERPAIKFQIISTSRDYKQDGDDGVPTRRIQVDIYGDTYAQVKAVRDATLVLSGINHISVGSPPVYFHGIFFDDERDFYESVLDDAGPKLFRKSYDWFVTTSD